MTPEFDKCWKNIGLTDQELKELQEIILLNPQIGVVVCLWHNKKTALCCLKGQHPA